MSTVWPTELAGHPDGLHPRWCAGHVGGKHRSRPLTDGGAVVFAVADRQWRVRLHTAGTPADRHLHDAQKAYLLDPAGTGR